MMKCKIFGHKWDEVRSIDFTADENCISYNYKLLKVCRRCGTNLTSIKSAPINVRKIMVLK